MDIILSLIEEKSERLAKNPFCHWILNENQLSPEETFSFTPSMLYFVVGFRDILTQMVYQNPQSELEIIINQHCLEDKNHWQWYLQDLKTLGITDASWGNSWSNLIQDLWHDDNKPTRDLVYLCIHLIKKHQSPAASLVIIECLESSFGVFMSTLKERFGSSSIYQKLHYFGQVHEQQEMNHSMGHWISSDVVAMPSHSNSHALENLKITDAEKLELSETITLIFDQFELVFNTWLDSKNIIKPRENVLREIPRNLELQN